MNFKKITFYLFFTLLLYQCNTSKNITFKDGKCYGKCIIPDDIYVDYEEYAVFTGDESKEDVDIEIMEIIHQEKTTKWEKKKADKNCLSANPDDCYVWCLVEIPENKEVLTILKDTTQSANYTLKRIEKKEVREKGGFTDWKEVLCETQLTKSVISQIQDALGDRGYYDNENSYKFDSDTKKALSRFQTENYLPIGQLDLESLDVLGIVVGN